MRIHKKPFQIHSGYNILFFYSIGSLIDIPSQIDQILHTSTLFLRPLLYLFLPPDLDLLSSLSLSHLLSVLGATLDWLSEQ